MRTPATNVLHAASHLTDLQMSQLLETGATPALQLDHELLLLKKDNAKQQRQQAIAIDQLNRQNQQLRQQLTELTNEQRLFNLHLKVFKRLLNLKDVQQQKDCNFFADRLAGGKA